MSIQREIEITPWKIRAYDFYSRVRSIRKRTSERIPQLVNKNRKRSFFHGVICL